MHLRKLLIAVIALAIVPFAVGLRGQGLVDGIKVTLPEPVTLGDTLLEPGEYEIRRASSVTDQVLRIFNKDKMVYQGVVLTIPTLGDKTPEDTKVILHHIGDNYYFDKIWMEDKDYGYEFPLPERVRALQRELAVSVPARYEPLAQPAQSEAPEIGLAAQLDAVAAQQEGQSALEAERQAQLERDRQAELDRQAQLDRDRVAALQPEPAPVTPRQSEAIQSDTQIPEQLPKTATNWLAFVLGGAVLLTLSLLVRPSMQG